MDAEIGLGACHNESPDAVSRQHVLEIGAFEGVTVALLHHRFGIVGNQFWDDLPFLATFRELFVEVLNPNDRNPVTPRLLDKKPDVGPNRGILRRSVTAESGVRFDRNNQGGVMRKSRLFVLMTAIGSAWLVSSGATASPTSTATDTARITVLYDAFGKDAAMTKDWGYAALVEIDGKRILFDTGDDPAIFAKNVKAKGVDLTKLDFVVLSHRHSDHVSGVSYLLSVNPKVKIYAPKEGFGIFGSDLPGKFYRTDEALPAEMRYYGGRPPEIMRFGTIFPGANIQLIDKTTELVPGITLIALVSDAPGTKELKELSLAIDTADGMVLVVGCSHPGIESIVAEAARIDPHIHFIAGGLHLVVAQDPAIEKVVTTLHDTYKVDYVAPGHCSGEPAFAALQRTFGDHYLYAGLGTTLNLGANPRAASDRRATGVPGEVDLRSHRTPLAQSK